MSIDQMRRDMPDAVRQLRVVHEWGDADIADLKASVSAAVQRREHLELWAAWLHDYATNWRAWVAAVRETEDRARELARAANAAAGTVINQSKGQRHDGNGMRHAA